MARTMGILGSQHEQHEHRRRQREDQQRRVAEALIARRVRDHGCEIAHLPSGAGQLQRTDARRRAARTDRGRDRRRRSAPAAGSPRCPPTSALRGTRVACRAPIAIAVPRRAHLVRHRDEARDLARICADLASRVGAVCRFVTRRCHTKFTPRRYECAEPAAASGRRDRAANRPRAIAANRTHVRRFACDWRRRAGACGTPLRFHHSSRGRHHIVTAFRTRDCARQCRRAGGMDMEFITRLKKFALADEGQDLLEYALLVALIALVCGRRHRPRRHQRQDDLQPHRAALVRRRRSDRPGRARDRTRDGRAAPRCSKGEAHDTGD